MDFGSKGDFNIGPQRRRSTAVGAVALLDETMKQPLRHIPTYVVHHVDLREMSRRLRPALGIKFQPHFGEGPIFQTRDDVSDGACTDGLEHDLHRGRAVVPIHVQPIFGAIEARHFAAPGPMDFGLHAVA